MKKTFVISTGEIGITINSNQKVFWGDRVSLRPDEKKKIVWHFLKFENKFYKFRFIFETATMEARITSSPDDPFVEFVLDISKSTWKEFKEGDPKPRFVNSL